MVGCTICLGGMEQQHVLVLLGHFGSIDRLTRIPLPAIIHVLLTVTSRFDKGNVPNAETNQGCVLRIYYMLERHKVEQSKTLPAPSDPLTAGERYSAMQEQYSFVAYITLNAFKGSTLSEYAYVRTCMKKISSENDGAFSSYVKYQISYESMHEKLFVSEARDELPVFGFGVLPHQLVQIRAASDSLTAFLRSSSSITRPLSATSSRKLSTSISKAGSTT